MFYNISVNKFIYLKFMYARSMGKNEKVEIFE